jgi:hypothetical protein
MRHLAGWLLDKADLVLRKCGEPRGLGDDNYWENDVPHLEAVAQQLAIENAD